MLGERKYAHIWSKYRPVILSLMKASVDGVQSYQMSNHEFIDINPKKATGYTFSMQVHERKTVNDVRKSLLAPDLMAVLRLSGKAMELSDKYVFSFDMDKNFLLQISSVAIEEIQEPESKEATETETVEDTATELVEEVKSV